LQHVTRIQSYLRPDAVPITVRRVS